MRVNIINKFIVLIVLGSLMLPAFAFAQTGTIKVRQPVGDIQQDTGGGDHNPPQIIDVSVKATYNSAVISWATNEISLGKVSWGVKGDYESGQISVEKFDTKHDVQLTLLRSQTQYFFSIEAIDQSGNTSTYTGRFLTLVAPDLTPPRNVTNFTVTPAKDHISLSWINPPDPDFDFVRIVRDEHFFPLDPGSGAVVYEGSEQQVRDGAVHPGVTYFYTVFARDKSGNFSSGVVGAAQILWYSEQQPQYPDAPIVDIEFPQAPGQIQNPAQFGDFKIVFNHGAATVNGNNPQIPEQTDITVSVPQEKLPLGTQSLILTITDQLTNQAQTYLFYLNQATKEYVAQIPSLIGKRTYNLTISIFNSVKQILQTITGTWQITAQGIKAVATNTHSKSVLIFILAASLIALGGYLIYTQLIYVFAGNKSLPWFLWLWPADAKKKKYKPKKIN